MDELFGSGDARFAAEDLARKERIERDIGLDALLRGDTSDGQSDEKVGSGIENHEHKVIEKS
jgi:hypothetical protein